MLISVSFSILRFKRDLPGTSCGATLDNEPSNSLSYMLITHIYFISLAVIGLVCLILTMLRKPGDTKVYEPLLTDTELVRVSSVLSYQCISIFYIIPKDNGDVIQFNILKGASKKFD